MKNVTYLSFIFICLLNVLIYGQNDIRYVSPNGSNTSNDCTDPSNPCGTIQYAINEASDGATIDIDNGVYTEPLLLISKSISLDGADDTPTGTVIQAAETPGSINARVIWVLGSHNVSIKDLIIRNGKASGTGLAGYGGGIRIDDGGLNIDNVKFEKNIADDFGGGIYMGPTVNATFNNVFVRDNKTETSGGGIYMDNGAVGIFSNVVIERNTAEESGGGIYMNSNTLGSFFGNVRIQNNQADVSGGGITMNQASGSFTNVTIKDNKTLGIGGGIRAHLSSPVFLDVVINNNSASQEGGGMYNSNGSPRLTNVDFVLNHTEMWGGGLYHTGDGHAVLDTVNFLINDAVVHGGGIVIIDASAALSNVEFSSNEAGFGGGGLWNNHDNTVLENVSFISNTAKEGGGMYNTTSSPILANVKFQGNLASGGSGSTAFGGGMFNVNNSNPMLRNVVFLDNLANGTGTHSGFGGGIANHNSFPNLLNVTITGNSAKADLSGASVGGGILNEAGSSPLLVNTIIWGNTADFDGNEISGGPNSLSVLVNCLYDNAEGDIGGFDTLDADENSIIDNPVFLDAGNGDVRLQQVSPAIDIGVPDISPNLYPTNDSGTPVDLDGNPRFSNVRIDLGAYEFQSTTSAESQSEVPTEIVLHQNYPNPFNPSTKISWQSPVSSWQTLKIYDVLGNEIKTLADEYKPAGNYEVTFDASELSSGVYLYKLTINDFVKTKKLILMK